MHYNCRVCKDLGATVWLLMHVIAVANIGWSYLFPNAGCKTACLLPCQDLRTALGCSCNCAWHSPNIPHTDGSPCKACFLKYMLMWFVSVRACVGVCVLHVTGPVCFVHITQFPKNHTFLIPRNPKPKTLNSIP